MLGRRRFVAVVDAVARSDRRTSLTTWAGPARARPCRCAVRRGSPSARSPIMFLCTSVVPPPMRDENCAMHCFCQNPSWMASSPASMPAAPSSVTASFDPLRQRLHEEVLQHRRIGRGAPLVHDRGLHAHAVELEDALARVDVGEHLADDRIVGAAALPGQREHGVERARLPRRRRSSPPRWRAWCGPRPIRRCTSPITFAAGMRTSDRNTSLKCDSPVACTSGRMSMPGVRMSTTKKVMPWCLGASGSVRASRMP